MATQIRQQDTRGDQAGPPATAKLSFVAGDDQAYIAGIIAVLIGAALVFFLFPKKEEEPELLLAFHQQDMSMSALPYPTLRRAPAANNLTSIFNGDTSLKG